MKVSKSTVITLVIIFGILILVGTFTGYVIEKHKAQTVANSAAFQALETPEIETFTSLSGDSVTLTDHIGKVIVAHSWASWCLSCKDELQKLSEMTKKYSDKNVAILAINRAEDKLVAERYLNTYNLDRDVTLVLDPTDSFYKSINGYAMPETVIYDQSGEVILHVHGEFETKKIDFALESLLGAE